MNDNIKAAGPPADKPGQAAEVLHLEKLLQTRETAWLRLLKEAQAKEQCRQL